MGRAQGQGSPVFPSSGGTSKCVQVDHRHAAVPRACDRRPCTFIGCSQYVPGTMVQAEARARVLHRVLCLVADATIQVRIRGQSATLFH